MSSMPRWFIGVSLGCVLLACLAVIASLAAGPADAPPAVSAVSSADTPPANVVATGQATADKQFTGAQARLMAQRGARVVAMRNLAQKVFGQEVTLDESGTGQASTEVLLKGAREVNTTSVDPLTYEVTVSISLRDLARNLLSAVTENERILAENAAFKSQFEEQQPRVLAAEGQLQQMLRVNKELADSNQQLLARERHLKAQIEELQRANSSAQTSTQTATQSSKP